MDKKEPNLIAQKTEEPKIQLNKNEDELKKDDKKEEKIQDPKVEPQIIIQEQQQPLQKQKEEVQKDMNKKSDKEVEDKSNQEIKPLQINEKVQEKQISQNQDKNENIEHIQPNQNKNDQIKKDDPEKAINQIPSIQEKKEPKIEKVIDQKKDSQHNEQISQNNKVVDNKDQIKQEDKVDQVTDNIHDQLDLKNKSIIKNPEISKDKTPQKKIRFQDEEENQQNAAPGPENSNEVKIQKSKTQNEDEKNKFSLSEKEQLKRLNEWLVNMKSFKFYNADQLPPPKLQQPKFYCIQMKNLSSQFKMPEEYKDNKKYHVALSFNFTLCDPKIGLFGRTSIFKQNLDENGQILAVEPSKVQLNSWIVFHSDIDLQNTYVISEIVVSIFNVLDSNKFENNISLGIVPIKILNKDGSAPSGQSKMKILLQSPRIFMTFYDGQKMEDKLKNLKNSQYEIEVQVNEIQQSANFQQFQKFLQSNCLLSPQDIVPGIVKNKLPPIYQEDFVDKINFEKTSLIWVHNIKIENLDIIEGVFQKYLQNQVANSGFKADITQRKLSCTLSNSCFIQTLQQVTVDIKCKEVKKGQFKIDIPSAPIKIQNVPSNRLSCIVWRVSYRVKYTSSDSPDIFREFVLGRNPFFPNFDLQFNSGFINDRDVSLTLDMCPELAIINDLLWNVNESQVYKEDLYIKISMQLSNTEDLKSEQQQRDLENQYIEQEMQKKTKSQLIQQTAQNSGNNINIDEQTLKRLAQLEIENQKLKQQNQQIIEQTKQEKEKLIKSQNKEENQQKSLNQEEKPLEKKEIPKQKDNQEIQNQNKEINQIEKLDEQQIEVPKQKQTSVNNILDVLINREDTDVCKLIELLKKLIEKTNGNEEIYKDSISKLQQQIIFLLEKDPFSQLSVFGTSGRFKALQFNNLSDEDKLSIIQNSSGQDSDKKKQTILNFPEQNYRPKLDIELKDQFKASSISFKFVAFKTPSITDQSIQLPQRLYFTFKFYMYRETQTDQVLLRLPKNIAKNLHQQNLLGQRFLKGKQYFLMKYEGKDKFIEEHQKLKEMNQGKSHQSGAQNIDEEYIGLSANSMEINFDFDPTSILGFLKSQNKQGLKEQQIIEIENQQHELFCKYLNERVLTIDIWNGDSLMHFGTCKIPLFLLMRQGEQSKVIGQEFDVIDQEYADRIGGLQMVLTNQGRTIQKHKSGYRANSPLKQSLEIQKQKNKKIVTSNPIEIHEIQETLQDKVAQFTVLANQNEQIQNDEQLRKQMRIQRLKKLGLALDGGINPEKFNDEGATFWEKQEELNKIKLIREQNKANLITKVTMDAEILNQKTINVVSGEANLFELKINNPFDKKSKFKIQIEDQDLMNGLIQFPELNLVDNENQEWDYWFKQGKCQEPTQFLELSSVKMNVLIESCQEVNLLFKFQSFREPVVDTSQIDITKQDLQNELRPRQIKIKIINSDSFPIFQILLNVNPMEIINDQVFRFYEAQKTKTQSRIPNFIQYISSNSVNTPPLNTCKIISSNSKIKIETSASDDLLANVENKESMTSLKGYVYIFKDKYLSQLVGSCKIEIYSVVQIKIKVKAGEEYDYKLNVFNPCNQDQEVTQRVVEVFSSDNTMVYPPDGQKFSILNSDLLKKQNIWLIKGSCKYSLHQFKGNY